MHKRYIGITPAKATTEEYDGDHTTAFSLDESRNAPRVGSPP